MPRPKGEAVDRRIVECWRAGMRSPGDIARRIGLDPMHVGRRIARMTRARAWPFEPPRKGRRAGDPARLTVGTVPSPRPPARVEPTLRGMFSQLNLRIRDDLHARLRAHCRETGATVSETVAEALDRFLRRGESQPPRTVVGAVAAVQEATDRLKSLRSTRGPGGPDGRR